MFCWQSKMMWLLLVFEVQVMWAWGPALVQYIAVCQKTAGGLAFVQYIAVYQKTAGGPVHVQYIAVCQKTGQVHGVC